MRTTKLQRYDKTLINDYRETPEGYLTVNVPITRPGVFPYRRADGNIQMEAKLPDEIFSDLTIHSARSKPVTDEHPSEPVNIDNYQSYAKGMSHNDSHVSDLKLYVSLTITDKALIQKIRDGKREISIGFMADVVAEQGTYNGQQYEFAQRNLEINHIAIVDQGRAGPEVAIRSDSDAWQIEDDEGGTSNMAKYTIDSKEYEVDSAVKSYIEAQNAKLEAEKLKVKEVDTLQGRLDAQDAQLTAKDTEIALLKEKSISADEMDKKVEERVALIATVQPYLGDSYDFTGKTERELKEAVILTANPEFKGDSKSDEYVNAFYDATVGKGFSSTGDQSAYTGDSGNADSKEINDMKAQRLSIRS
ncbi:DUF2213 domain-containing protein [Viridibacillus sp. NPDC096237]|uniref:DUF2213 domain-containing protein n=1 Tax=Viridibacillus sp. NPDC096237 TaxID=3390721 RepID=UPI003CFE09D0